MKFLLELLARSPFWAIRPESVPLALLALKNQGTEIESESNARRFTLAPCWEAAKPSMIGGGGNKVAVIPIQGVLTKDGPAWYGSNYDNISRAVEDAAANPDVKHIVLAVDSPGGEVTGLPETAALVAQAAKVKPVTAVVDGMSASAAYYLTSQANNIVLTPSGEVGSVGVRMMHVDFSKALENDGIAVTELYSGDFKTEWSPYKPLSEEAKADMLPRLQAVHQDFINAVQAGRGARLSQDIQDRRLGEGRMLSSKDALAHGMVDAVQPARDFFRAFSQETAPVSFPALRARMELDAKS
jgi:capsid assembly protease